MTKPYRVLFVCYGNIMRSAFAEAVMRAEIERLGLEGSLECWSAGVRAATGESAEPNAARVARQLGYSMAGHSATRTGAHNVAESDAIYVMDGINYDLLTREQAGAKAKTAYLSTLDPETGGTLEIGDPYLEGDRTIEQCFRRIERCVKALVEEHQRGKQKAKGAGGRIVAT